MDLILIHQKLASLIPQIQTVNQGLMTKEEIAIWFEFAIEDVASVVIPNLRLKFEDVRNP